MFEYYFNSRVNKWYRHLFHHEFALTWKITVTGSLVTLYTSLGYMLPDEAPQYRVFGFHNLEHHLAHSENHLADLFPSTLRDSHMHISLPGKNDIYTEFCELLDYLLRDKLSQLKRFDEASVADCKRQFSIYLNNTRLDERKTIANSLILEGVSFYADSFQELKHIKMRERIFKSLRESYPQPESVTAEKPDVKPLGIAIVNYLTQPTAYTLRNMTKVSTEFFKKLADYRGPKAPLVLEVTSYLSETSQSAFNDCLENNAHLIAAGMIMGQLLMMELCNWLEMKSLRWPVCFLTLAALLYFAESLHTFITNLVSDATFEIRNPTLLGIMRQQNMLMYNERKSDVTSNQRAPGAVSTNTC